MNQNPFEYKPFQQPVNAPVFNFSIPNLLPLDQCVFKLLPREELKKKEEQKKNTEEYDLFSETNKKFPAKKRKIEGDEIVGGN